MTAAKSTATSGLGVTNAWQITDAVGTLIMTAPGNDITLLDGLGGQVYPGIIVTRERSTDSLLQGSMGPQTIVPLPGTTTAFTAQVGDDSLTGTGASTDFYGDGGAGYHRHG